jgi:hypothetical protein
LSDAQHHTDELESTERGLEPPADPRPSEERDDDASEDARTSPFPYAEKFGEWVADETTTADGPHRSAARDAEG